MKNTNYTSAIFAFLTAFFLLSGTVTSTAQSVEIYCPDDICGSDDDFGATDGIYTETGATQNDFPIYAGPAGSGRYQLRLESSTQTVNVPEFPFPITVTVYRWHIHRASTDELVYFESEINTATFAYDEQTALWNWDDNRFDPAPTNPFLPVELSQFSARVEDENQISLYWQTSTEINNDGFEVERSTDGQNWETLDFVLGGGTTRDISEYSYADNNPYAGINYYRLKQFDFDGDYEYSWVVKSEIREENELEIYPNPASQGYVTLGFENDSFASTVTEVYDNLGRRVKQVKLGYGEHQLDISDLTEGLYTVTVYAGRQLLQKRLIVR